MIQANLQESVNRESPMKDQHETEHMNSNGNLIIEIEYWKKVINGGRHESWEVLVPEAVQTEMMICGFEASSVRKSNKTAHVLMCSKPPFFGR